MDILQMSVSAGVLILVTAVVRVLAINKLPKKMFIVLWGIALCRLIIPFSIPSKIGFVNLTGLLNGFLIKTETARKAVVPETVNYQRVEAAGIRMDSLNSRTMLLVWAVGTLLLILFFAVSYYRCFKEISTALPVKNNPLIDAWLGEQNINRRIRVLVSDRITTPLTYGIINPRILIPKSMGLDDVTQTRYILTHEFVHIKRFDALWKLMLVVVLCFHWFNPLVWILYLLMNRDLEITCDEKVIRLFGENMRSAYALSLIGMAERKARLTPLYSNFSKNATEERIVSIMKFKKTPFVSFVLALILVAGAMSVFAESSAVGGFRAHGEIYGENGLNYSFDIDNGSNVTVRDASGKVISTTKVGSDGSVVLTDADGKLIKKFIFGMPPDKLSDKNIVYMPKSFFAAQIKTGAAAGRVAPVAEGGAVFSKAMPMTKEGAVVSRAVPVTKGGAAAGGVIQTIKVAAAGGSGIPALIEKNPEIVIDAGSKGDSKIIADKNVFFNKVSMVKKDLADKTIISVSPKPDPNNNLKIWYNYNYNSK